MLGPIRLAKPMDQEWVSGVSLVSLGTLRGHSLDPLGSDGGCSGLQIKWLSANH